MEKITIPKGGPYKAANGHLGFILENSLKWETCRERFQTSSANADHILYYYDGPKENIIEFIRTIEQIINLPAKDALLFHETTEKNVIYIKLTPWWQFRVRKSLLTAFLRCSQNFSNHSGEGFVKALWSMPYTNQTKKAIMRFLDGFTACRIKKKDYFDGWQNYFQHADAKQIEYRLVRLKKKKEKPDTTFLAEGI